MTDLLIVGEGLSGLFAAVLAAQHGARTTLVAQGRGSLSLSHGCIDIWAGGALPEVSRHLPAGHPYRIAGWNDLERALAAFLVVVARGGLVFRGNATTNLRLPTSLGGTHITNLAPDSLARGNLTSSTTFTVASIEGFRDFSALLLGGNLARSNGLAPAITSLPLIGDAPRRDLYAHELAARFDDADWRSELARAWKPRLGGVQLLGLPAVLGIRRHDEVVTSLEEKLDLRLFEIPTLPPSLPGLRLESLLRRTALAAGVRLIEGPRAVGLVDGRSGGRRVGGVVAHAAGGPRRLEANAVILATGGVLNGGWIARQNGRVVESVFDLPILHVESRSAWTSASPLEPQPYAAFGLQVDSMMRPVSAEGTPYFENLFAAGGILGGCDRSVEGSRQGIDLLTAFRAVESALGETLT